MLKPTKEGEQIIQAFEQGKSIIVNAVAGAGKSTLSALACNKYYGRAINYIVYTVANKQSMTAKIESENTSVGTINAYGNAILAEMIGHKTYPRTDTHLSNIKKALRNYGHIGHQAAWNLFRLKYPLLTPDSNPDEVTEAIYSLCASEGVKDRVAFELNKCFKDLYKFNLDSARIGNIDFVDQIWAPLHLKPYGDPFWHSYVPDCVILDEAQDASAATHELLVRSAQHTQLMAVGDRHQNVMGFAGSYAENMSDISDAHNCVELPLSLCYRCPDAVIALAQTLVPQIRGLGKRRGSVNYEMAITSEEAAEYDMVVSARYAPLLELYFDSLRAGIPVHFEGRDVIADLIRELRYAEKISGSYHTGIAKRVKDVKKRIEATPTTLGNQDRIQKLKDIVDSLWVVSAAFNDYGDAVKGLNATLTSKKGLLMTSIHKAKGLEAERVVFIDSKGTEGWEEAIPGDHHNEAANLAYVGFTRAQKDLLIVKRDF